MNAPTLRVFSSSSFSMSSIVASAAAQLTGIAAERVAVRAGRPVHELARGHGRAQRHARGDALGDRDDVGDDARPVLDAEPLAGAAHAALHLVHDRRIPYLSASLRSFSCQPGGGMM
jgi:hypothetical protein